MSLLWHEIRKNPLLWLLVFVPAVLAAEHLFHASGQVLFILSVLAIVPLAALLSHATESVAAKTGDAVGGLLNATLGNLTELVIALTALGAGQYMLVKASIAGAIVTNALFMLGASLLLGGLRYHTQEFNAATARLQAGQLFLATIALLVAALSGGPLEGALCMALFAIGSGISLGLAPSALRKLQQWANSLRKDWGTRIAGLLLAAAAAWALWMDLAHRVAEWCGIA